MKLSLKLILFAIFALTMAACGNNSQPGKQPHKDQCPKGEVSIPQNISPKTSKCTKVVGLGCSQNSDCPAATPFCIKRRTNAKDDVSFCSKEKQCYQATDCASDEACLSKDNNFNRGICTKITQCSDKTQCETLKTTLGVAKMRCDIPTNIVPQLGTRPQICLVDDEKIQIGKEGCDKTHLCQDGAICAGTSSSGSPSSNPDENNCTLSCTTKGFGPECTSPWASVCAETGVFDQNGNETRKLVCLPTFLLPSSTFVDFNQACDDQNKLCHEGYACVGTKDNPTEGVCKPLCKIDSANLHLFPTCNATNGGTNCNVDIDLNKITIGTKHRYNTFKSTYAKTCGK